MACVNNIYFGGREEVNEPLEIEVKNVNEIKNKVIEINKNVKKLSNNVANKNEEEIAAINEQIENINVNSENVNVNVENVNIPVIPSVKNIHVNKNKLMEPIGILDPEGKKLNPLTGEPYQNLYKNVEDRPATYSGYAEKVWTKLPTYGFREKIINTLFNNQCVLVTAGTGSGKTVLVPKFLLHVLNYQGKIAITIPRTAPTLTAAEFAAKTLDVELGEEVGYSTQRYKNKSPNTKLLYLTDGTILAKLNGSDPNLDEFDGLIIDEAHERNPNIDQILLLVKQVLINRPDFKLVIMSATIDPKIFMNYYKEFGIKHIDLPPESNFKVTEIFLEKEVNIIKDGQVMNKEYQNKTAEIIFKEIILPNKEGDVLALVPSPGDGPLICIAIEKLIKDEMKKNPVFKSKPFCISFHAGSGKPFRDGTEKNYAVGTKNYKKLNEGYTRRIIMATEVAESSITFEGDTINFVVDTGLSNSNIYYPKTEVAALEKKYIAKANHLQRVGRTGRKQEGTCYNVFTKEEYKKFFLEYPVPKLQNMNIIDIVLTFMLRPNITHIDLPFKYPKNNKSKVEDSLSLNSFLSKFIDPPFEEYVSNAIKQLFLISAIEVKDNKGYLTEFGRAISFFSRDSVDPQKAAAILKSYNYKCSDEVINIMAALVKVEDNFGNIFMSFKPKSKNKQSKEAKEEKKYYDDTLKKLTSPYGDHISIYKIMKTYKEKNYNISWERGRETLEAKGTGEGAQWARDNFINAKKLKDAIDLSKDLKRPFAMAIANYRRDNPDKVGYIFRDTEPNVHEKIEDNIMQAITEGFIGNVVKKAGRNYKTCFPEVQSVADVDRDSLFRFVSVKPATCLFGKFISIFGRKKFQTFSKVPIKVIDNLNPGEKEEVKKCEKSVKANTNKGQQGKKGQPDKKGQQGKKGQPDKKGQKWSKGKGQKGQKGQRGQKWSKKKK